MGATSRCDFERGVCVSTGKLAPAGEEHVTVWGNPERDGPMWRWICDQADWCDSILYTLDKAID